MWENRLDDSWRVVRFLKDPLRLRATMGKLTGDAGPDKETATEEGMRGRGGDAELNVQGCN